MANFGQLDLQLHQIAWSAVARMPSGSGIRPADPWEDYHEASNLELRAGALALLRVYTQMIKVLQRRIDLTVKEALTYEASYGEIAAACGVSRQAARQRWLRRRERYELPKVRLVGGPQDGEWERVKPGEQVHVTLWNDGPRRPSGHATYAPSEDDPRSYVFTGLHE